eukprot:symbB.v1.2.018875.t1/scaffold1522.1/size113888/6
MNNGTTLRRKRSKSAPDATLVEEVDTHERLQGEAPEVPDETPLEQSRSGSVTQTDVVDMVNLEALDIFLHRTDTGTWVITPLGSEKHRIELRPRSDGLPPPGCKGVIWRLDDQVLNSAYQELQDEDEEIGLGNSRMAYEFTAEKSSPRAVARRLEKVSSGMKRLGRVTVKLEAAEGESHLGSSAYEPICPIPDTCSYCYVPVKVTEPLRLTFHNGPFGWPFYSGGTCCLYRGDRGNGRPCQGWRNAIELRLYVASNSDECSVSMPDDAGTLGLC